MRAIDTVIAISKALDGWDGTPEQAAEKLGVAVAIVKTYTSLRDDVNNLRWVRSHQEYGPGGFVLRLGAISVGAVSMSLIRGEGYVGSMFLPGPQKFSARGTDEREVMKEVQSAVVAWIESAGLMQKEDIDYGN